MLHLEGMNRRETANIREEVGFSGLAALAERGSLVCVTEEQSLTGEVERSNRASLRGKEPPLFVHFISGKIGLVSLGQGKA